MLKFFPLVGALLVACSGSRVCAVVDLAAQRCDRIPVKLPDGREVLVRRAALEEVVEPAPRLLRDGGGE
jgi:hypothetical protein